MAFAREIMGGGISAGAARAICGQGASLAATGTVQGDAALVKASTTIVTAADGNTGVILPASKAGEWCTLFNNSGSTLKVYPPTGAAISVAGTGLGSANTAFSQLTYKSTMYICQSSTQWFAITSA